MRLARHLKALYRKRQFIYITLTFKLIVTIKHYIQLHLLDNMVLKFLPQESQQIDLQHSPSRM